MKKHLKTKDELKTYLREVIGVQFIPTWADDVLDTLYKELDNRTSAVDQQTLVIDQRNDEIDSLRAELRIEESTKKELDLWIADKNAQIERLTKENAGLRQNLVTELGKSGIWKVVKPDRSLVERELHRAATCILAAWGQSITSPEDKHAISCRLPEFIDAICGTPKCSCPAANRNTHDTQGHYCMYCGKPIN